LGEIEWEDLDAKGKWRNVTEWGMAEEVDVVMGGVDGLLIPDVGTGKLILMLQ
jgi:hypothetical protein